MDKVLYFLINKIDLIMTRGNVRQWERKGTRRRMFISGQGTFGSSLYKVICSPVDKGHGRVCSPVGQGRFFSSLYKVELVHIYKCINILNYIIQFIYVLT